MRRDELEELHYIAAISNVASILLHGILSNHLIKRRKIEHESVADSNVQDTRSRIVVPGQRGRPLHHYANLYFNARNTMLYRIHRHEGKKVCVIRVNPSVIELPEVVIADGNAASEEFTAFWAYPDGLDRIEEEIVYARSWNHANFIVKATRKRQMCAEVLVPDHVDSDYITGIYVCNNSDRDDLAEICDHEMLTVRSYLFF